MNKQRIRTKFCFPLYPNFLYVYDLFSVYRVVQSHGDGKKKKRIIVGETVEVEIISLLKLFSTN